MRHARSRNSTAGSRGLTLVEVVLAVLLLSLTISMVMGAVSSMAGNEGYERKRLAAYEVANRIMLQYLDDPKGLPPKHAPLEYGPYRFFWELDETPAVMTINRKQEASSPNLQALDRFKLIGVIVYESEGEANTESQGEPLAFLSRAIDPFAPRNPDSLDTYTNDPDKIMKMIQSITGGATAGDGGTSRLQGSQLK